MSRRSRSRKESGRPIKSFVIISSRNNGGLDQVILLDDMKSVQNSGCVYFEGRANRIFWQYGCGMEREGKWRLWVLDWWTEEKGAVMTR